MAELGKFGTGTSTGLSWMSHVSKPISSFLFGNRSLQTKFIIFASAIAVISMFIMAVAIAQRKSAEIHSNFALKSVVLAETITIAIKSDFRNFLDNKSETSRLLDNYISDIYKQNGFRILYLVVHDNRQLIVAHSSSINEGNAFADHVRSGLIASSYAGNKSVTDQKQGLKVIHISVPLADDKTRLGTLSMAISHDAMESAMHPLPLREMALPVLILIGCLGIIVLMNRRFIKPVSDLAEAMESAGGYLQNVKIEEKGDDEILVLSQSFNSMIDRIRKTNQEYMKTHEKLLEFMEKLEPPDEKMLGRKIYIKGSDEVNLLCKRYNSMIDRLQESNQKLVQSQKLASIGILASGVAHEINNPIGGMFNCVKMLEEVGDSEELRHKYHELIKVGLSRIEDTVGKLLLMSRRHEPGPAVAEVDQAVDYVLGFIEYKMKKSGITFSKNVHSGILVQLPPLDLQQVFINLMMNSVQAMDQGGSLGIKAIENGSKVIVEVSDTGCGIGDMDVQKIFDPFYTTKRPGEGTGLGLWLVYEIVKKYDGEISVKSDKGQGTVFTLIFNKA